MNTMSNKLHYLFILLLFVFLTPVRGMSQTDDGKSTPAAPAHNTHVIKKAWNGTKQAVSKGAHATAHATGKAWRGTKRAVSKGAKSTAHATGKAWDGTKHAVTKGYNSTAHPKAKPVHKKIVKQADPIRHQSGTE
jgi:hypothetical protein